MLDVILFRKGGFLFKSKQQILCNTNIIGYVGLLATKRIPSFIRGLFAFFGKFKIRL